MRPGQVVCGWMRHTVDLGRHSVAPCFTWNTVSGPRSSLVDRLRCLFIRRFRAKPWRGA